MHHAMTRIMKTSIAVVLLATAISNCTYAQQGDANVAKQAEIIRGTTGRILNEQGFAETPIPVRKGFIFDVVSESLADVVLIHNGRKFKVAKADVRISEKASLSQAGNGAFTPGQIVLISAKYTVLGNQPRNVKNRLSKLIPPGVITEPISIQVTDDLSTLARSQGQVSVSTVDIINDNTAVVRTETAPKNILTVEYSFNGQVKRKQALEGSILILP